MKFFSSKKKLAVVAALITTMATGSLVFAASTVKQDAYYDTFRFVVNGNEQAISDAAFKPFIANSRVYVPMATMNSLGIANVQWTPAAAGQAAVLNISPKGAASNPADVSMMQQQVAALTTNLSNKEAEVKKLTDENNALKDEIAKLKKNSSSSSSSSTTFTESKIRDLQDELKSVFRRQDFVDSYSENNVTTKVDFGIDDVRVSAYRDELDIELYADRGFVARDWEVYAKGMKSSNLREMDYFLTRYVVNNALDEFKDVSNPTINITIYDGSGRNSNKIVTAEYYRRGLDIKLSY